MYEFLTILNVYKLPTSAKRVLKSVIRCVYDILLLK